MDDFRSFREREERYKVLKEKIRQRKLDRMTSEWEQPTYSSYFPSTVRQRHSFRKEHRTTQKEVLAIRLFISIILLGATFLLFRMEGPFFKTSQDAVREVMEREFNFKGVVKWYEQKIGTIPTFFPNLSNRVMLEEDRDVPVSYAAPVLNGAVISPFVKDGKGVLVGTDKGEMVTSIDEGWITYIGPKDSLGQVVIVQHRKGIESWYGYLGELYVQVNDWVKKGAVLGKVRPDGKGENGYFYFSMKKNGQFVDPMEVIPFE
ncbi:M23 family metallopeptidase [Microaerobacter geothermalis]|uniref:M23 family metallopeptidase n=1 Tax=Microaerobacter geothermalis TaxID=674972 RepID=UPI001F356A93|nr:M23 family metallopeptidase [Microaerobacter geothermalis]MCF6092713.1 M23 family metallopeptidase [Microaerobacter geothermalis]